ncbi:MAG: uracil-DNA glycosylase [Gemmataceae bacterium]|nr:uracil-DNA glycosylase [Gemmataceae bacterium]
MADSAPSPADPARQARQYLESLQAAGVEWLPAPHTAPLPAAPPVPSIPAGGLASGASLVTDLTEPVADEGQAGPEQSLEHRRQALDLLAEQVSTCSRCPQLLSTRTQTVFGNGPVGAELCFIGEAPGADEDAQGVPFVGAAGQLLNRILAACGMKREEVYVCNILRCRPPGNRTPRPDEAANCRDYLERQLELVGPKFICALGGCAAQNLLGTTVSLGRLRGRFHDYRGIPVLVTYHPAYLLPHRSPEKKKDVWEDMKLLMSRMGRTIPARPGPSGPG